MGALEDIASGVIDPSQDEASQRPEIAENPFYMPDGKMSIINNETGEQSYIPSDDWDKYKNNGYTFETVKRFTDRLHKEDIDSSAVEAAVTGAASELTFGLSDLASDYLGVDMGRQQEIQAANPLASGAGHVAGFLGGMVGPSGIGGIAKAGASGVARLAGREAVESGIKIAAKRGSEKAIKQFALLSDDVISGVHGLERIGTKEGKEQLINVIGKQQAEISHIADDALESISITPEIRKQYELFSSKLDDKIREASGILPGDLYKELATDLGDGFGPSMRYQKAVKLDGEPARVIANQVNRVVDSALDDLYLGGKSGINNELLKHAANQIEKSGADTLRIIDYITPLSAYSRITSELGEKVAAKINRLKPSVREAYELSISKKLKQGLSPEVAKNLADEEIKFVAQKGLTASVIKGAFDISAMQAGQALSSGVINQDSDIIDNIKNAAIDGFIVGGVSSLGLSALGVLGSGAITKVAKYKLNKTIPNIVGGTTIDALQFYKKMSPIIKELNLLPEKALKGWGQKAHKSISKSLSPAARKKFGTDFYKDFNMLKEQLGSESRDILTNIEADIKRSLIDRAKVVTFDKRKEMQGVIDFLNKAPNKTIDQSIMLDSMKREATIFDNSLRDLISRNLAPSIMEYAAKAGSVAGLAGAAQAYSYGGIPGLIGGVLGGRMLSKSKMLTDKISSINSKFVTPKLSKMITSKLVGASNSGKLSQGLFGSIKQIAPIAGVRASMSMFGDEEVSNGISSADSDDIEIIRNNIRNMRINEDVIPGSNIHPELGKTVNQSTLNALDIFKKVLHVDSDRKLTRREISNAKEIMKLAVNPGLIADKLSSGKITQQEVNVIKQVNPNLYNNILNIVEKIKQQAKEDGIFIPSKIKRIYDMFDKNYNKKEMLLLQNSKTNAKQEEDTRQELLKISND